MRVGYVAGPYRGSSAWAVEQNIREAETLALEVWRRGAACICPHTNTRFFQGALPDQVWLEGDLEMLRRCDFLVLTSRWRESLGAKTEHDEARKIGIPVFHEDSLDELSEWLGGCDE